MRSSAIRLAVAVWLVLLGWGLPSAHAQEEANDAPAVEEEATPPAADGALAEFNQLFEQWKGIIQQLRELQVEYKSVPPAEREAIRDQFNQLLAQGEQMAPQLEQAARTVYEADPNADKEVANFLASIAATYVAEDRYEQALELAQLLIDNDYSNKSIYNEAARAAFATQQFELAEQYFAAASEANALRADAQRFKDEVADQMPLWEREQELRQAEAEADDLPRVVLKTTAGDITVELFENEAPNTVANFISLVEAGTYDGLDFHRVLPGFMAQGGDPKGDGTGGPGYAIACEVVEPNHRNHFQGSLSMAHAGRDTGGSQFFITFAPTPHLNGQHTVFGRVIEGMDVLPNIVRREPGPGAKPATKITDAEVVRKRDHDYTVKKIEG